MGKRKLAGACHQFWFPWLWWKPQEQTKSAVLWRWRISLSPAPSGLPRSSWGRGHVLKGRGPQCFRFFGDLKRVFSCSVLRFSLWLDSHGFSLDSPNTSYVGISAISGHLLWCWEPDCQLSLWCAEWGWQAVMGDGQLQLCADSPRSSLGTGDQDGGLVQLSLINWVNVIHSLTMRGCSLTFLGFSFCRCKWG